MAASVGWTLRPTSVQWRSNPCQIVFFTPILVCTHFQTLYSNFIACLFHGISDWVVAGAIGSFHREWKPSLISTISICSTLPGLVFCKVVRQLTYSTVEASQPLHQGLSLCASRIHVDQQHHSHSSLHLFTKLSWSLSSAYFCFGTQWAGRSTLLANF